MVILSVLSQQINNLYYLKETYFKREKLCFIKNNFKMSSIQFRFGSTGDRKRRLAGLDEAFNRDQTSGRNVFSGRSQLAISRRAENVGGEQTK